MKLRLVRAPSTKKDPSFIKKLSDELLAIGAELYHVRSEYDRRLQELRDRQERIVDRLIKGDSQESTSTAPSAAIKTPSSTAVKCRCIRCQRRLLPSTIAEASPQAEAPSTIAEASPQVEAKPQTSKWRCTRCRRTRRDEPRQINKTWRLRNGKEIERVVIVCEDCYRRKSPCETCAGLAHRVEGEICVACGLPFAEEVVLQEEAETFSPIAAFEDE